MLFVIVELLLRVVFSFEFKIVVRFLIKGFELTVLFSDPIELDLVSLLLVLGIDLDLVSVPLTDV